jgi:hypothetical protein
MSQLEPPVVEDAVLDGNAVGGTLAAAFGAEMTGVPGACAHCGAVSLVAELRAYLRAPGIVLRCPICTEVVIRVAELPTGTVVDLRGAAWLRIDRT